MTVRTYYKSKTGSEYLSTNFKVKEFACNDGTDKILIDSDLVAMLQKIRDHFKKPITINSAYRTPTYNKLVGGSSTSYHVKGMAADICIAGISPIIVGIYAETIGAGGIGVYNTFTHVDTRSSKYRWLSGGGNRISKVMPTLKEGTIGESVKLIQGRLGLKQDGIFTNRLTNVIKAYQAKNNLLVDGIVGKNTWIKLFS